WSVPNQCAELGALRMSVLPATGLTCAISPGAASRRMTTTAPSAASAQPSACPARARPPPPPQVGTTGASAVTVAIAMIRSPYEGWTRGSRQPRLWVDDADDEVDGALHDRDVLAGDRGGQVAA